jgi:hypothetical protein
MRLKLLFFLLLSNCANADLVWHIDEPDLGPVAFVDLSEWSEPSAEAPIPDTLEHLCEALTAIRCAGNLNCCYALDQTYESVDGCVSDTIGSCRDFAESATYDDDRLLYRPLLGAELVALARSAADICAVSDLGALFEGRLNGSPTRQTPNTQHAYCIEQIIDPARQ